MAQRVLVAMLVATFLTIAGSTQEPASRTPEATANVAASTGRELTAADSEAWLDGYMPYALARAGIPGAVVVIVSDGHVLLEKGYGTSDEATGRVVDPQRTIFRVGSISKLFTWTAVMQLVQAGQLDLDQDVNRYLDFTIPSRNGKPITLRNLMSHRSGFEDATRGIATEDLNHIPALGEALKRWTPQRVNAAGTTTAYSNYGAALAGYIVERVSRMPFDTYIATHILEPLGMQHSTFDEPLPPALSADMSKGYERQGARPGPFEIVVWKPAGSLSASGDDMARFMIAHLQNGRLGTTQILNPDTAEKMHTSPPGPIPTLSAMGFGFENYIINGHQVIGHEGDTALFHSLLRLFPSDNTGIFLSLNSPGTTGSFDDVRRTFYEAFADRYLPGPAVKFSVGTQVAKMHARMFANAYGSSRASSSNFRKALNLFREVHVIDNADGTISVSALHDLSGGLRRYRESTPFVWNETGGHDRIAVIVEGGRITRFGCEDLGPVLEFTAIPYWMSTGPLVPMLYASIAVLLLTIVFWPFSAVFAFRRRGSVPMEQKRIPAVGLVRLMALVALVAVAGWVWVLLSMMTLRGSLFVPTHLLAIRIVQTLSICGFCGGFAASLYSLFETFRQESVWIVKVWGCFLAAAMSGLLLVGFLFHLIGFNANV